MQTQATARNTNCLDGIRCPKCGSLGPFNIGTYSSAIVHDDGISETSDHEWDKDSPITCRACDMDGSVADFADTRTECDHPPEQRMLSPFTRLDRNTLVRTHECRVCRKKRTHHQVHNDEGVVTSEYVGDWWQLTDEQRARDRLAWSDRAQREAIEAIAQAIERREVEERDEGSTKVTGWGMTRLMIAGIMVATIRDVWVDSAQEHHLEIEFARGWTGPRPVVETSFEMLDEVARHHFETGGILPLEAISEPE